MGQRGPVLSRLAAPAAANGAVDGALAVPVAQLNDLERRLAVDIDARHAYSGSSWSDAQRRPA